MKFNSQKFAQALRDARFIRGINQTQLGEAVGLSRSMISRYETGDNEPSLIAYAALCKFLRVPMEWFME